MNRSSTAQGYMDALSLPGFGTSAGTLDALPVSRATDWSWVRGLVQVVLVSLSERRIAGACIVRAKGVGPGRVWEKEQGKLGGWCI